MINSENDYNAHNPEVQNILNDTDNLISEVNSFIQQNPTPTQQPNVMSDTDNLINSNNSLKRELNRLNHNIEMERIKELSKLGSPYTYY
jgi:hypothetical protein